MKKALVIGINKYAHAPLRGCVQDATDMSRLLETNGDHTQNFNVLLKTDVMRKSTLRGLIADLFAGEQEIALFYFSGHGAINERGGYLVLPDHAAYDEGISMNELLMMANQSKTKNRIIILDCCYSGAITAPELNHRATGHIDQGVTILSASRHDEAAVEVYGKGVFTNLLLEGLRGGAADLNGRITPGSIYAYIDQALGAWDQRPIFKTNVSSFSTIRTVAPKLPLISLKKIVDFFPTQEHDFPLDPSYEYTNDPGISHTCREPYATAANTGVFRVLQQMQSAGLVAPVGEDFMYWAAMNSKSCRLTPLGAHYWRLVEEKKI